MEKPICSSKPGYNFLKSSTLTYFTFNLFGYVPDGNQDYLKVISLHLVVVHWLTDRTNSWGISTQQNCEREKNYASGFSSFLF